MKLGIDAGNGYVKYSLGKKFASTVRVEKVEEPYGEVHSVNYGGIDYEVGGAAGTQIIGYDKYFKDEFLMLILTGIALRSKKSTEVINANFVLGVPADLYKKDFREKLRKYFLGREENIIVDGQLYNINLANMEIMLEGGVPFMTNDTDTILVIDVGAGTVDCVLWKNKRKVHAFTINEAFYKLSIRTAQYLKDKHNLNVRPEQVNDLIGKNQIKVRGEVVDTPELAKYVNEFVSQCANIINAQTEFQVGLCDKVRLIGGGAESTFDAFQTYFSNIKLLDNSQYINQIVYEKTANAVFYEE